MNGDQNKKNIADRSDVSFLVRTFYAQIRQHEQLGPIFNGMIHDWEPHLDKLTDFWEGNLFFLVKNRFNGDPKSAHIRVDEWMNHTLTMEHFGWWLNLWIQTLNEHFEGETAERAKQIARKMGTFLFLKVIQHREATAKSV
jgi:hemoglobin